MALRHAPIAIAALLLIGCGGGSSAKPDGGGTGGSISGSAGTGGSSTGGGGSAGGGAAGGGAAPANPTGSLVLPGEGIALLDAGAPCTNEEGATGDRWCAVFGPPMTTTLNYTLWVFNASKAAAGTSVNCASGADPNCIKLIDTFGEDQYHSAWFQGDTLIYYDQNVATFTPFAWRPGMTAGRKLATGDSAADVWACTADTKGTAAWCLRDLPVAMQTDPTHVLLSDLLAGHVDGAASPPLARIETVISGSSADNPDFPHFQVGFPVPGSETIAWSARPTLAGVETLKTQTIGNDASRATVATDVNRWQTSPDGTHWFWLSHIDDASGAGTLQSAPYPAGISPVMVAANVVQYAFPTMGSLAALDSAKALKGFTDPIGAPTTSVALDTGVLAVIAQSRMGHLAYVKTAKTNSSTGATFTDIFIKKVDGTGACTFTSNTDADPFDFLFTPSSGGASWLQRTIVSQGAMYTRLSDCTKMPVSPTASTTVFTRPLNDRGILYVDNIDDLTGTGVVTLVPLDTTAALSPSTAAIVVSGQVGSLMPVAAGATDLLIYTVNGGGTDDGVYVRGFGP
jgi:hypothetical protein